MLGEDGKGLFADGTTSLEYRQQVFVSDAPSAGCGLSIEKEDSRIWLEHCLELLEVRIEEEEVVNYEAHF